MALSKKTTNQTKLEEMLNVALKISSNKYFVI